MIWMLENMNNEPNTTHTHTVHIIHSGLRMQGSGCRVFHFDFWKYVGAGPAPTVLMTQLIGVQWPVLKLVGYIE